MIRPLGAATEAKPDGIATMAAKLGVTVEEYEHWLTTQAKGAQNMVSRFGEPNPSMPQINIHTTEHWTVWLTAAVGMAIGIAAGMLYSWR
jgi:hypothetical protein